MREIFALFCEADLQSIRCGMFDARSPNEADLVQIKSVRTTVILDLQKHGEHL